MAAAKCDTLLYTDYEQQLCEVGVIALLHCCSLLMTAILRITVDAIDITNRDDRVHSISSILFKNIAIVLPDLSKLPQVQLFSS